MIKAEQNPINARKRRARSGARKGPGLDRAAIESRRDFLKKLLDLSTDGIFVRAFDGQILYWNRGAERLYGWSRAEAMGKNAHALLKTEFPTSFPEVEAALLRTGEWTGELKQICREGEQVITLCRKALKRDARGEPRFILESNTNITERKRVEQAERKNEAI